MIDWVTINLGDAATFFNGYAFKPSDWGAEGREIVRIQNLTKSSKDSNYFKGELPEKYKVVKGDLLISWSATLGVYEWNKEDAWVNQHIFKVVFDKKEFDKTFFKYLISSSLSEMEKEVHGSTMKHITKKRFDSFKIPFPPLEDQKKIAAILDAADALRQKDNALIAKYEELTQSLFLDMFGDPVTNSQGWKKVMFGKVLKGVKYGTNQKGFDDCKEGMLPVLRIPNIVKGEVDYDDLKYSNVSEKEKENLLLEKGDLLFVRSNGNPKFIGKCAIFNGSLETIYASYLIRARLKDDSAVAPFFVSFIFGLPSFRREIIKLARTTAGNFNLNTQGLKGLSIISPPTELQNQFAERVQQIEKQKQKAQQSLLKSEELFNSLLQLAFKGELTKAKSLEPA